MKLNDLASAGHTSHLQRGNTAYRAGNFALAVEHYGAALAQAPGLSPIIAPNLVKARDKYREGRRRATAAEAPLEVGVCGWELSHNAAGRVFTLAQLYSDFCQVKVIGCLLGGANSDVWEPVRQIDIPTSLIRLENTAQFLDLAFAFVATHPLDLVHLSKPRAPNIFIGLLYKLIWGATVLMDIDDEELAFVGAPEPQSISDYLQAHGALPALEALPGKAWTQLSVNLATAFDGATVPNAALQGRYGGAIIAHARDEALFQPTPHRRERSRRDYGIASDKQVVLFFGTPRAHKGLLHTASAIAQLKRQDTLFVIVGDFPEPTLKPRLLTIPDVSYCFIGNQPFHKIPDIVAMADVCVLYQHAESLASRFQTPAKLSDALAMGIPVIASPALPLQPMIAAGAIYPATDEQLPEALKRLLDQPEQRAGLSAAGRVFYERHLGYAHNRVSLKACIGAAWANQAQATQAADGAQHAQLRELVETLGESRLTALFKGNTGVFTPHPARH